MLIFILILSILIFVHELGHFIVAKRLGIKVEKFSLGFGPKLCSKKIKETEYMICAIPFGGFIKMSGDTADEFKGRPDDFLARKPGQRASVIFAGPLFNYILAFFCLWAVYILGFPRVTSAIGEIVPGMPASAAGLRAGDKVLEIGTEPVQFWDEVSRKIYVNKDKPIRIKVGRGSQEFEVTLTPQVKEVETVFGKKIEVGLIGIKPSDEIIKVRYGVWQALAKGTQALIKMTNMTLLAIYYLIIGTMSFKESVTGPLGIFFIATGAAKMGSSAILHVIGILSMSLAIFNLLPLPILDGGHIALLGLEKLRKRPLSRKTEDTMNNIGLSFLIILAIFIFCNDLVRYGYWDKFLALFWK